ncbi:MAG TPA: TOBE domain-containing protein, partial [Gaiellaceae bacterium]|nr:TOBE domain-containing protein [Gaiellaceae bacterium]
ARILGLEALLKRKPAALSGGQRQRVALARAVVRRPEAFLMDEPLSNLDAKLRVQMRGEISRIQRQLAVTTVYVTHDQVEAMTMGDRVAVMRRGVLQQFDAPQRLYEAPANLFVASFIGSPAMNVLEGTLGLPLPAGVDASKRLAVGIRPEALSLATNGDGPRVKGVVRTVEALGPEQLAHVEIAAKPVLVEDVLEGLVDAEHSDELAEIMTDGRATVIARLDASAHVRPDDAVELAVDTRKLHFFDLETGAACR